VLAIRTHQIYENLEDVVFDVRVDQLAIVVEKLDEGVFGK
jgi:hypothetical protein